MRAFVSKLAAVVLGLGLLAMAGEAAACNTGCPPPAPPTPPSHPTPPTMPCHSCGGHGGGGGSTDVNVNVNVKASGSASASSNVFGSSGSVSYGGGYGNWSQTPGNVQPVGGLNVITDEGGAMESYSESRSFTRTTVMQASCIDDTGVPHPASQVFQDRAVASSYRGEIYRCIAGTHMQVTMADFGDCFKGGFAGNGQSASSYSRSESSYSSEASGASYGSRGGYGHDRRSPCDHAIACSGGYGHDAGYSHSEESHDESMSSSDSSVSQNGMTCAGNIDFTHINFDGGKTMTCQKGDALWFEQGALTCRPQIPARQCNERSLLRRFGVGMKVLTVTRTESVTRQRQVASQSKSGYSSVMVFDGGVGGFVQ